MLRTCCFRLICAEQNEEKPERWSRRTGEALNLAPCNIPEKNNPASPCCCRQQRNIFAWNDDASALLAPTQTQKSLSVCLLKRKQKSLKSFHLPAAPAGSCDHLFVLISLTLWGRRGLRRREARGRGRKSGNGRKASESNERRS